MHLNYNHNLNSNSCFCLWRESTQQPQLGDKLAALRVSYPTFRQGRSPTLQYWAVPTSHSWPTFAPLASVFPVLDCGVLSPRYYILSTSYLSRLIDHGRSRGRDWKGRGYGGLPHSSIVLDMTGPCHIRPHSAYDCMHKTHTKSSQTKLQYDL